jgi:copper chaperone CopZ
MKTIEMKVTGMTCGGCAKGVARALTAADGVTACEVNLGAGTATVTFDPDAVSEAELAGVVRGLGYGTGK